MTYIPFDPREPNYEIDLRNKLHDWLESCSENTHISKNDSHVIMLPRNKIHTQHPIEERLHLSDGLFKEIRYIRIMNFASNLFFSPTVADAGHLYELNGISLSGELDKIYKAHLQL